MRPLFPGFWTARSSGAAAAVLLLVVAACSGGAGPPGGVAADAASVGALAADAAAMELVGIEGWINSEPLTIAGLVAQRRVVLVDFWTYTCVNCIRTLPFVRDWDERYGDHGLTVLGVHTPEFEFEHLRANVEAAVAEHGLGYAVAQDNDYATWQAFDNHFWPAKYLIGADGNIRYQHFGEGAYGETEQAIRAALEQAGYDLSDVPPQRVQAPQRDATASGQTRELYGGYARNYAERGLYAGQEAYYLEPDRDFDYEDPGRRIEGRWYLQGRWRNEREAIVHARTTEALEDYLVFGFRARSVNVVLNPLRAEPFEVVVELDGRPLTPQEGGADIVFDAAGRSVIRVLEPRLYALVELPQFGSHELTLRSNSDNFAVFAFTFGIYTEGA